MKRYKAIAEYYDSEYAARDMLRHDVPFFLEQAGQLGPRRRATPRSVLELAVGTARAAIPIAQAGLSVVGVDYDADLLAIAKRKRDATGLRATQLRLVHADIRDLRLGRRFDWVCLFFNTFLAFPTLAEQDQVFDGIRRHLKPGGRAWLDFFQPTQAVFEAGVHHDLNPTLFHVPALGRTVFKTITLRNDPLRQVQRVTFHYRWFDANGREQRERSDFEMTALWPRELQLLVERHGMRVERMWGNYDGSDLTEQSPRVIACCAVAKH